MINEETQAQTERETVPCDCGRADCNGGQEVVTLDELGDWLDADEVKYGRWEKGALVGVLAALFAVYEWVGGFPVLFIVGAGLSYFCYVNMLHMKPRIMNFKDLLKRARKIKASGVPAEDVPDDTGSGGNYP